jgi:hypothetical protein
MSAAWMNFTKIPLFQRESANSARGACRSSSAAPDGTRKRAMRSGRTSIGADDLDARANAGRRDAVVMIVIPRMLSDARADVGGARVSRVVTTSIGLVCFASRRTHRCACVAPMKAEVPLFKHGVSGIGSSSARRSYPARGRRRGVQ